MDSIPIPFIFLENWTREIFLSFLFLFFSVMLSHFIEVHRQSEAELKLMNIFFLCWEIFHFSCVLRARFCTTRYGRITRIVSWALHLPRRLRRCDTNAPMNHVRIFQSPGCDTVDMNLYYAIVVVRIGRLAHISFICRQMLARPFQCHFCWWIPFRCATCVHCAGGGGGGVFAFTD